LRAVVQRVTSARVTVGDRTTGEIGAGLLVLLGVDQGDGPSDLQYIASKIRDLRIFADPDGKMNLSVLDTRGAVLVVSHGRRPSFASAAPPDIARALYEAVVRELQGSGLTVATGEFQAMMQVALVNDGPVTILLDSRKTF
jgi:D-tyrosyl-tRNA(Tyr) deacylase